MLKVFGLKSEEKREDDDTFAKRIRGVIEENTCATSGIKVFEHEDETALDDYEMKVLENLRVAHEEWNAKHGNTETLQSDAFKSVKVRVDK